MAHLINSLCFEIHCSDEGQAFNIRHNFAQTLQKQIEEIVDRVCSLYVEEGQSIRIDKLHIDLGRFTPSSLETEFKVVFLHTFEKELTEQLAKIPKEKREYFHRSSHIETLQYFLQTGTLPWWIHEDDTPDIDALVEASLAQADTLRTFFLQNRQTTVWERAALQFHAASRTTIISFFEELTAAMHSISAWREEILKNRSVHSQDMPQHDAIISRIILLHASDIFESTDRNSDVWHIVQEHIQELLPAAVLDSTEMEHILSNLAANIFPSPDSSGRSGSATEKAGHDTVRNNASGSAISPSVDAHSVDEGQKAAVERYIVNHAGIVILNPFLKMLFTRLGLMDGSVWVSREAQYKAVHLLKYLSTGREYMPEYTLSLEKIFCGISISEPIPREVVLEEHERNEAESLLHAVIEHWAALKNTSVAGLRETFLKRDGLLTRKENNWLLQVERKTVDVLLQSIPWNYSSIHLGWNSYLIFVEW